MGKEQKRSETCSFVPFLGLVFSSKDSLWAECGHEDQRGLLSAASVSPQTWIKCASALVRAVGSWGEELFVWCFLGHQQNEVESCQEVTHLTDMCMLWFLKHVFEALLAKKELQLVKWGSWHFQHGQAPHQWSRVLALGSLHLSFRD